VSRPKQRFAAVDTLFILQLQRGDEDCQATFDELNKINFYFIAPDTVVHELGDMAADINDAATAAIAKDALGNFANLAIIDPTLDPVRHGVAEVFANKLIDRQIISENEKNDGLVVAESALHGCILFLTFRQNLLKVRNQSLRLALVEADLPIAIVQPAELLAYFRVAKAAK
jgi:hypothetical protein